MGVRKFYSKKRKAGWKFDAKKQEWYSHGFDIRRADGKRIRESGFFSEADAYAAVAKIRLAEKEARYGFINSLSNQPTLKALCERRVRVIKTRRERIRAERVFRVLMDLLGPNSRLPDITTSDLQKFTDHRLKDVQPQSVSREWNIIAAAFNSARDFFPQMRDWVPPGFPRPKGAKKKRRTRLITPKEIIKALTWFYAPQGENETAEAVWNRRTVGQALELSLLTSARKGSLCQLRKTDIDFDKQTVKITDIKNLETSDNPVREVPLTPRALAILRERCEKWPYDFVFTRQGGEITHYYQIWKQAAKETGIAYGQKIEGGFRPHDARHTAATTFYRKTKDLTVVRAFTGHESDQLFVYLHEDEQQMKEAAQAMEIYIESGLEESTGT